MERNGQGPNDLKSALAIAAKGFCMGTADVIPGVSGGTVALILGIYERLVLAIASIDAIALKTLAKLDIRGALARIDWRFLVCLFAGIGLAILSLARIMPRLLDQYPAQIRGLFFGLILASAFVVVRMVEKWNGGSFVALLGGTVIAYRVVGLIPVQTPNHLAFIFLCGVVGISAMILPGLSGAFILLILGKWKYLLESIHERDFLVILVFGAGCAVGLLSFVRLLRFLLQRYHGATLAGMLGLMIGSLRKVWPFKETLETMVIRGKTFVLAEANILPSSMGGPEWMALGLCLAGIGVVLALEWTARPGQEKRRK